MQRGSLSEVLGHKQVWIHRVLHLQASCTGSPCAVPCWQQRLQGRTHVNFLHNGLHFDFEKAWMSPDLTSPTGQLIDPGAKDAVSSVGRRRCCQALLTCWQQLCLSLSTGSDTARQARCTAVAGKQ